MTATPPGEQPTDSGQRRLMPLHECEPGCSCGDQYAAPEDGGIAALPPVTKELLAQRKAEGWHCGQAYLTGHCDDHPRTPAHDPGLDHLLEEVAVEVLRQDAAGEPRGGMLPTREYALAMAAAWLRSVRAIDQAAGGERRG